MKYEIVEFYFVGVERSKIYVVTNGKDFDILPEWDVGGSAEERLFERPCSYERAVALIKDEWPEATDWEPDHDYYDI